MREGIRCSECTRFDGVHSRTSVVEPMMGPRGSAIRALMRHYKLARGVERVLGEVEISAVNVGICRELRM